MVVFTSIVSLLSAAVLAATASASPTLQSRQAGQTIIDFTLYDDTQCFAPNGFVVHVKDTDLNSNNQTACNLHNFRSLRIDSVENGGDNCAVEVFESIDQCNSGVPTGSFKIEGTRPCRTTLAAQLVAWKVVC